MRKTLAAAATLGLATLGVIVPTSSAQASTACDNAWNSAKSGYFYAYAYDHCYYTLGSDAGDDEDWNNGNDSFTAGSGDQAASVLHKGTSGMSVKLYENAHYGGGHICIKKSEYYMDTLNGWTFNNGHRALLNISSHQWVWDGACAKFLDS
ncbi:hypothetical protein AB0I00_00110 [Streptomyces sp. NPDC050803]|uniref:hypothetical protein n=1 Tax=unclassified Streptomyces TaxID=2593676 RepID=UPI00344A6489